MRLQNSPLELKILLRKAEEEASALRQRITLLEDQIERERRSFDRRMSELVIFNEELRIKNDRLEHRWGPMEQACELVCAAFRVNAEALHGRQRFKNLSRARQVLYYIGREHLGLTTLEIAARFQKDHTTITHGTQRIAALRNKEPDLDATVRELEEKLFGDNNEQMVESL